MNPMMCGGAPLLPPIATRFAYKTRAAADVMDVAGSPPPYTPSGSSSSETTTAAPQYDKTFADVFSTEPAAAAYAALMAEAEWGLAAAAWQMPQRLPSAAKPSRRQQVPPTTAKRGAAVPVPPPIKLLRYVPKPQPQPPPADVMDAGSSAPSTPSECSSLETTPSPHGPLPPAFSSRPAAPFVPAMVPLAPPLPTAPAPPPRVEVRQVWAHNFEAEAKLIESLLPKFRYAAVDTEFPGTVYRPAGGAYTLTPQKRYELLRLNVDELDLIQLGLTLFDAGGRLPCVAAAGGGNGAAATTRCVWEFNFREFDVRRHRHAPESIAMLRAKGVDFDRTRRHGVGAAAAFGPRLRKWLRAGLGRAGVVTFSGGYDVAYLVKAMFGSGFRMPGLAEEFEGVAAAALSRRRLFDVKEMARLCPADLRGGLDSVAAKLDVGRAVGEAHQAGSDSLLTCHAFVKMRESYFDDDMLGRVAGVLTDINAASTAH